MYIYIYTYIYSYIHIYIGLTSRIMYDADDCRYYYLWYGTTEYTMEYTLKYAHKSCFAGICCFSRCWGVSFLVVGGGGVFRIAVDACGSLSLML